jgi:hypothetical protein
MCDTPKTIFWAAGVPPCTLIVIGLALPLSTTYSEKYFHRRSRMYTSLFLTIAIMLFYSILTLPRV